MTHDWQTQDLECQRRFSRNLRLARERAQLTQADVAEALEMTVTVYARYERGKIWPSIGALRRLCDVLACSADVLLGFAEPEGAPGSPSPPKEPLPLRRLRRQFRLASPETLRLVDKMLDKLQEHGVLPDADASDNPANAAAASDSPAAASDSPAAASDSPADDASDSPADAASDSPADDTSDSPADDVPGDR